MRIEWAVAALLFAACGDDSASTDGGVDQRIVDGAPTETGADGAPEQGADSSEDTSPEMGGDAGGPMPFTAHTEASFTPNACCGAEVNTALDASGRVHVFAHQQRGSTRSQWYLVQNGDDWNSTNITEDGSLPRPFSERSAFTLDAGDAPHGLFSIGDGTLHYAFLDGTWQAIPIGDSNVGNMFTHFDIAVDAGGDVHVVWFDRRTLALRYGRRNGDAFDVETVDPPADGDQNGEYARIAVASDGTLHLSYLAIVGDAPILRHASGGAGSWSVEDVPGENKGVFGTILLNGEDRPMIASAGLVSSRAQGLYVSRFDGSWSETSLVADDSIRFGDLDAALGPDGQVWVVGAVSIGGNGYPELFYPLGSERSTYQIRGDVVGRTPESVALTVDDEGVPLVAVANRLVSLQ